jgi:hypothetical protein
MMLDVVAILFDISDINTVAPVDDKTGQSSLKAEGMASQTSAG